MNCRGPRLQLVAGLAMALAMPMLPAKTAGAQGTSQGVATQTSLTVETQSQSGQTQATVAVAVSAADGLPAGGAVNIEDGNRLLTQALLSSGQASAVVTLAGGSHALQAVYLGDVTHRTSVSNTTQAQGQVGSTPNFQVSLTPVAPATLPLTLTPGNSGTLTVTVTPENNAALTAPMFVTLSCSGLPEQAACSFAPEDLEIVSTTPASCPTGSPASACPPTSLMVLQTQAQTVTAALHNLPPAGHKSSPIAWAFLLPGALGLGGLAWGARRRRWLQRLALMALVGLVTTLGATACNPLYYYYNHGPTQPPATPSGTYTVTVTAQSSNGVTAITNSTTMVLTVN